MIENGERQKQKQKEKAKTIVRLNIRQMFYNIVCNYDVND